MKLFIKNMVCERCKMAIKVELEQLGLTPTDIQLGSVEIQESTIDLQKDALEKRLHALGFALLSDKKARIAEQIKAQIIELIHRHDDAVPTNLSSYLAQTLQREYTSLSTIFSETVGSTIEKYFIKQKIEKVKELLTYDELNLNEIAFKLHYSSVAHLSNQFKKITGLSPSAYKKNAQISRTELDKL